MCIRDSISPSWYAAYESIQAAPGALAIAASGRPDHREGSNMGILGDLGKRIASAAQARDKLVAARERLVAARNQLVATSELHLAFSFDAVSNSEKRLEYAPRCTA